MQFLHMRFSRIKQASCMQVVAQQGRARCSRMRLPHYTAHTPMFMPVGTRGKCKAQMLPLWQA